MAFLHGPRVRCTGCSWLGRRVFAGSGDECGSPRLDHRRGFGPCPTCGAALQRLPLVFEERKAARARRELEGHR